MEYPAICSSNLCHLKSASFRNNEQFLRTFTELIDCRSTWRKRITFPRGISDILISFMFSSVFASLRKVDRYFMRIEKNTMLRDYIRQFIEVEIIPNLIGCLRATLGFKESRALGSFRFVCASASSIRFNLGALIALFEAGQEVAYKIIVSVIALSIVYQYLLGHVNRGGTKTYNPGSVEFRDTYVSLLLFRGAYVWIKFRDVASRTVRRRHKKDKFNRVLKDEFGQVQYYDKYEPRFTPPRENGTQKQSYLPLGGYDTRKDAELVCQIAGYYYGKDDGVMALENGSHFSIPVMSEQERSLCGEQKREWVSAKAKAVFKEIQEENASRRLPSEDQVDARGCSSSAEQSVNAPLGPASTDGINAFLEGLSTLAEKHGPLVSVDEGIFLDFSSETFDVPMPTIQERLNEELHLQKRQLAAEYHRRFAEEHQKYRRLEEENSELRQENKRLKTMLQQAANPLRAFFLTSTVELGSSIGNC